MAYLEWKIMFVLNTPTDRAHYQLSYTGVCVRLSEVYSFQSVTYCSVTHDWSQYKFSY